MGRFLIERIIKGWNCHIKKSNRSKRSRGKTLLSLFLVQNPFAARLAEQLLYVKFAHFCEDFTTDYRITRIKPSPSEPTSYP